MADKIRELVRRCSVGEYDFDIIVNRNIVADAFQKHPKLWKILAEKSKRGRFDIENIDDIETLLEFLEENDAVAEEIPLFVQDILPAMIKAADSKVDATEFLEYCYANDVDEIVNDEIYKFALMGFTAGRGVKTPKVKVEFK